MFAQKKEVSKHNFIAIWTIKKWDISKICPIFRIYNLCRQYLADAAHLAADVRLGDLRIAPRHVRIRMTQNLGDDIGRHPRMPRNIA